MQQKIKNNVFKDIITSIVKFEEYEKFAVEKLKCTILYSVKLLLIFSIIISIVCTVKIFFVLKNISNEIKQNINEIEYKNDELSINSDNPLEIEYSNFMNIRLIIDTSNVEETKKQEYIEKLDEQNGMILLKNECIIKNNVLNEIKQYSYQKLQDNDMKLDKDYILSSFEGINLYLICLIFFIILFIIIFIAYEINFIIYSIIFGLIGNITSLILRVPLKYRATYNIAVHSLTLPTLLYVVSIAINIFTGFDIKYFQIMYMGVTYIYIITAILMIKTDFIKRNIELSKII